ncbi:MAG: hypothetical protein L6R35_005975 [Caloplaca aegaea]|nr:MAG: hypothetical protein L6R35_005975 [Caloplaca aegaea]
MHSTGEDAGQTDASKPSSNGQESRTVRNEANMSTSEERPPDTPKKNALSHMSSKIGDKPVPKEELDLAMEYMQEADDVSKFVGLSLLRSIFRSKIVQAQQVTLRGRTAIPARFLNRLLGAADYRGDRIIDRDYMVALAVWVIFSFTRLVPQNLQNDKQSAGWIGNLLTASKISPPDTRDQILLILLCLAETRQGSKSLLMDDRWSLLPKLALKNEIAFQVIQCASKSAIFYGMSDALPKLCDMISSLAKVFRYHRVVTPCLECLDFLVDYVPKESSLYTWLEPTAWLLLESGTLGHYSGDELRMKHAIVLLTASLLRVCPKDASRLLFGSRRQEPPQTGMQYVSWLFVWLRLVDLQKSIPTLWEAQEEPEYPHLSERLYYSYNIISAFLSFPWRVKRFKAHQHENPETIPYPAVLVRQLEQKVDHVSALTMLYLIKRYDAAAKHLAIGYGDSIEEIGMAPMYQMEIDPVTTAQLNMVALWMRENQAEDFGPKVHSLLHVTLGLYSQKDDQRRPILIITELVTHYTEGVELFNHIDGWGMLVDDLEAIIKVDDLAESTKYCGLLLVDILFNVAHWEIEYGTSEEQRMEVTKLAYDMDSEGLCGTLEVKCAIAALAADLYQLAVRRGRKRSLASIGHLLKLTKRLLIARDRMNEHSLEKLEDTRTSVTNMLRRPFLLHMIVELPASIAFFLNPSMTLSQSQPHAHAVIRQYALLLMSSNIIAYNFIFRSPDETSASVAAALAVYHEDDKPFEVRLSDESFETYQLDPPPYTLNTTKKELKKMYYDMVSIRRMEMAADRLYKEKKIRGFCHLSTGQEAVAAGIENAITKEDHVITAYRCHGFALMRGGAVKSIIGELLGRREGIAYGKGGSMHMFSKGFYGGNGIVGAQVPVGAGIAFANQYNGKPNTTICLYGDGASNQGQVFEAFNMAKLWNLPILFGCENNKYGMGTAANRAAALTEYYKRGQYIPGLKVNGMDILAVKAAVEYGKQYNVAGHGPLVLEYVTYRYGGHSMSDPGTTYRTREEIQRMRSTNDPIAGLKQKLLDWEVTTEEELKGLDKQAKAYVDAEVKEAEGMPEPEPTWKNLYEDIYVRGSEPEFLRGRIPEENFYYSEVDMGSEGKRFEQERKLA